VMTTVPATEFGRNFATYQRQVQRGPIGIKGPRSGRVRLLSQSKNVWG
jgi:hypothetical protein